MKKKNNTSSRYLLIGLLNVGLLIFFSVSIFPQNVQYQENTVDKSFKSDLKVDPITLGMSFNLPIGSYVGRNGMNIPFTISYNSKVWEMEYGGIDTNTGFSWVDVMYARNGFSGWGFRSIGAGETGDAPGYYDFNGFPGDPTSNPDVDYYVDRLRIQMPDGSTHEFRKEDNWEGIPPTISYPKTYYSVDGTRMKYVKESATASTLYLPDGSRYVYGGLDGRGLLGFYDRHGNKISFSSSYTDTLGRTINPTIFSSQTNDQTVSMPGLNNASRNYILRWRPLKNQTTGETVLSNPNLALRTLGAAIQANPVPQATDPLFTYINATMINPPDTHNPTVLAEVELPNGGKYKFRYNIYGEVDKIIYPTGAYERFEYGEIPGVSPVNEPYTQANRGVKKRWVSESGTGNDEVLTQYSSGGTSTSVTNPDGTRTERIIQPSRTPGNLLYGFDDARAGNIIEERFYSSSNQLLRRTLNSYIMEGARGSGSIMSATRDARLEKQISIIIEPDSSTALMTQTVNEYDSHTDLEYFAYLNVKRVKEYGFVTVSKTVAQNVSNNFSTFAAYFTSQTPVRMTETDYLYDSDYKARNMTSLPTETRILDGQNNVVAKSQIFYDQSNYLETASISNAPGWENPQTSARGLPTTVRSWTDVAANQYVETHAQYDQFGNVRKTWDAKENVSEIRYDDNFTDGVSRHTYAFPTKTISPSPDGLLQGFETTVKYDFNTALPRFATDANNQTSEAQYDAVLLRPTKTIAPNGQETVSEYGTPDTNGILPASQRFVKVKTQIDAEKWKEGYSWFDGIGRTIKTQTVDSNGDVFTETEYDNLSRPKKATNPYRSGETKLWTESFYDDLGRVGKIKTPDNAEVLTAYSLTTSGANIGTTITVTDQAGKLRRSITNALGQLTRVDESNESHQLGTIEAPVQPTTYSYDVLNNLTQVQQIGTTTQQCGGSTSTCTQTRTFVYDSLSRLKQAANPESGTIQYVYDNNGNLVQKTDARAVVTAYTYDALNRVTARNYTAPANLPNYQTTPNVSYFYDDVNVAFSKGKLTKVSSSISETRYTTFDNLGRVLSSQQTTDGQTYNSAYVYNLSGALIEQTYPSGRVVKNVLDNDGDLSIVQSRKNQSSGFFNYAKSFTYTAAGAVSSMQLGNGKWESTQFNTRLQPTQIALGTVQNGTDKLKLDYTYGGTQNNGNVQTQTITVPTTGQYPGFTATQTYTYDSLNRLKTAEETGGAQGWKETYLYDRYGNKNYDTANTTTLGSCAQAVCNPSVNPNNNRLNGYGYDNAGNTTTDANSKTFTYDGENKQTKVMNGGNTVGEYFYDGDGKRVKKKVYSSGVLTEETIFVYDAAGKLVAEYSNQISQTPQVSYLTNDHLGSPRITTDKDGKVYSRRDFLPFGEELTSTHTSQRNINLNYGQDAVRQKFTAYERDDESELDFAQARMYANKLGRFTGVDAGPFTPADPQNFNRYSYVQNSPMKFTDPSGKEIYLTGNAADDLLNFLRDKSGLDLVRDTKNGKVTVKKGSKQNSQGSKEFAKLLKNIIGDSAKLSYEVKQNDNTGILFDNGEGAVVNRQKKTVDGIVDFEDIKETDKQAPELATTVVAHFLYEGLRLASGASFTADYTKGFTSLDGGAHLNALVYETKILSEYTGQKEKLAERRDVDYQKNATINFIYTSVQYDMVIKSTTTNAATIDKITKTKPTRAPQYPPGP